MATRVSPRSNTSSASTSSSSSRRAYRNTSFSKDRDGVDRWGIDGRNSNSNFSAGNQQHHHKGQWGQKSYGTERAWGNTGIQIRERSEESDMSWRSQKPALHSFQDGGRIQQPNLTYEPSYPDVQAARGQWNQAARGQWSQVTYGPSYPDVQAARGQWNEVTTKDQRYHEEGRSTAAYTQPVRWERPKQDQNAPGQMDHNRSSSSSYHNQGNRGAFTDQHHGNKKDPFKPNQGSRGFPASSSQLGGSSLGNSNHGSRVGEAAVGSRGFPASSSQLDGYALGNSNYGSRVGEAAVGNAHAGNRDWNYGAPILKRHEERMDNLPPLTIGVEPRARTSQAVPASPSVTARVWGGSTTFTKRWGDECEDDQWNISPFENESGTTSHRVDYGNSDVHEIRKTNVHIDNHRNFVRGVANKAPSRQNNWDGNSMEASRDSWAQQEPAARPGNGTRDTIAKAQMGTIQKQRVGTAGHSHKVSSHGQRTHDPYRGGGDAEGPTTKIESQYFSAQEGDPESVDDTVLPFIMGTCEDMCPLREREQRERLRDLAVFERLNGNPGKTSRERAVKKFCRTFSGVKLLSSDVRPLRVLWSTLEYLLNLLDDSEFPFDVIHNFLFDRTRAIRQELGMQRIANSQAINMYEEIVRFHILSEHELSQRGSTRSVSDSHLNLQQLSKALLSLFDLYRLNRNEKLVNEAEFRAYYVLLNLDSIHHYQADSLSVWFQQCSTALFSAWEVKFARAVLRCYRSGNYMKFFLLAQEATFLQSCLMEPHFNKVRLTCLVAMNQGGYKLHPIPLTDIAKQILMKEGDMEELCNLCGLATGMDASRTRCLLVKQSQFSSPKEIPPYRCACIVGKQPTSYYEEITGTNRASKRLS